MGVAESAPPSLPEAAAAMAAAAAAEEEDSLTEGSVLHWVGLYCMGERAKWVSTVPVVMSQTPKVGVLWSRGQLLLPRAEVKKDNPPTAAANEVTPADGIMRETWCEGGWDSTRKGGRKDGRMRETWCEG